MSQKHVYLFEEGHLDRRILGGKGSNLAEMSNMGIPVPPGFTITSEACSDFLINQISLPDLMDQVFNALRHLEKNTGRRLGKKENPLLVSVRSGSVVSMPGMMDTILNLGLNDDTAEGLAQLTKNICFANDCYRRFIQMYSNVVLKIDHYFFEKIIEQRKKDCSYTLDTHMAAIDWQWVIDEFKKVVYQMTQQDFPQDPVIQLEQSIEAVFQSWENQRAKIYRKINHISDDLGTAVNIQLMVFGNMGNDSGTGVVFTRNPTDGTKELYGEYLMNAQGEDVVAGIRTPQGISHLKQEMPSIYQQLSLLCKQLEEHYQDMQDIEFTVEQGQLYILQTRTGKRTAQAAVKVAVDMVNERLIDITSAISRIEPGQLDQILHRRIDPKAKLEVITKGLPASPGAASGRIVFDADEAEKLSKKGIKVILVRTETTPEDINGIVTAQGILTSRGGMTSHAAVIARGMGKACVCGCEQLKIDLNKKAISVGSICLMEGDVISINGSSGEVIKGEVPLIDVELSSEFQQLLTWADEIRTLKIRANADTPEDALKARELGAEGIGLCRTEHMFMKPSRVSVVQQMILAETKEERDIALKELLPMQKQDFIEIFKVMDGYPVNIRLLDPPLHEFLPNIEDLIVEHTKLKSKGLDNQSPHCMKMEVLLRKVRSLQELNPMLGHRGCRLGIIYPEIYIMQIEAIFLALGVCLNDGIKVEPEIMIPLVGHVNELIEMKKWIQEVDKRVRERTGQLFSYTIGTMIEVPRAAITAKEIASEADFFSFGTNDLTQTTLGYSRDDAEGKFLYAYIENGILSDNPFVTLDVEGVGTLMKIAVTEGRKGKSNLKIGICGEHGGESRSIQFCHNIGLNYVSCSPFRVPLARLSAAQSAIISRKGKEE